MADHEVLIIGGGLAGLRAAQILQQNNIDWFLVEKEAEPGGRVRTDVMEGFQMDRGFQVLFTAYPEVARCLDLQALDLQEFDSASLIARNNQILTSGPCLQGILNLLRGRLGQVSDLVPIVKEGLRIARLSPLEALAQATFKPLHTRLKEMGFSRSLRSGFLDPFLAGIFLDESLNAKDTMLDFVFSMLMKGKAAVPRLGMGAIAQQMVANLPADRIRMNSAVDVLEGTRVALQDGTMIRARNILLATDLRAVHRLLGYPPPPQGQGCTTLWFDASHSPFPAKALLINQNQGRSTLHMACLSDVCSDYAPDGKALIQVTFGGTSSWGEEFDWEEIALKEMQTVFGRDCPRLRLLKMHRIPDAHPSIKRQGNRFYGEGQQIRQRVYAAGDYLRAPSLDAALHSGRLAAEAILDPKSPD